MVKLGLSFKILSFFEKGCYINHEKFRQIEARFKFKGPKWEGGGEWVNLKWSKTRLTLQRSTKTPSQFRRTYLSVASGVQLWNFMGKVIMRLVMSIANVCGGWWLENNVKICFSNESWVLDLTGCQSKGIFWNFWSIFQNV